MSPIIAVQLQDQLRGDQARLSSQQSQLESWRSQLAEQQSQLEQLESQAADALHEAREAAAAALAERDQVGSGVLSMLSQGLHAAWSSRSILLASL